MDNKVFIKIINDSLVSFGFKKERYNFWIRKGKEVSTKIHLQRSSYSNLYYFHAYYVINNLPLKDVIGHCHAKLPLSKSNYRYLHKLCDLEYNISDEERIMALKNLIHEVFSKFQFIETEEELKEMLIKETTPTFVVVRKYLGIDSDNLHDHN